jgi:hypothetical protein
MGCRVSDAPVQSYLTSVRIDIDDQPSGRIVSDKGSVGRGANHKDEMLRNLPVRRFEDHRIAIRQFARNSVTGKSNVRFTTARHTSNRIWAVCIRPSYINADLMRLSATGMHDHRIDDREAGHTGTPYLLAKARLEIFVLSPILACVNLPIFDVELIVNRERLYAGDYAVSGLRYGRTGPLEHEQFAPDHSAQRQGGKSRSQHPLAGHPPSPAAFIELDLLT